MRKQILVLSAVTFALVSGAIGARAEEDSDDAAKMQQWEQVQQSPGDEDDTGMMGQGVARHCMRQCMRGDEMMGQRMMRHSMGQGGMMQPFAMRIIFALMDRDGDGTVSLAEFQAAHESIFKAMDADKDGTVSMEEMRDFFHGANKAGLPQRPMPRD
jgi:hypothetical protein